MAQLRPSDATVHRFSPAAVALLVPIFSEQGYPRATCIQAVESVRFHSALYSRLWYDWRQVFLFGARLNGVVGITLGDHVFLRAPAYLTGRALLAHEAMHVVQQRHRHLVPFLARYGWQWARFRLAGLSDHEAYTSLPDEVEARRIELLAEARLQQIQPWLIPA